MSAVVDNGRLLESAADDDDDEIGLGKLFGALIENRWLVVGVTITTLLLGAAYAYLAAPVYQADGLLQVEERRSGLGDLDISELFEGDTSVNAEIEILRSRSVLGDVVDNLKLNIIAEPKLMPVIGATIDRLRDANARQRIKIDTLEVPKRLIGETLKLIVVAGGAYELFDTDDNLLLRGKVGEAVSVGSKSDDALEVFVSQIRAADGQTFLVRRESNLSSIESLKRDLRVSEKGKASGILEIRLAGTDPAALRRQVNEIANVYVRQNVDRKSAEAQQTLSFLDDQLPAVKQDMETAEVALNSYRLEKGSIDLPLETQAILETIVAVEGQLNELQQERAKVTQAFTPAHPMVIALDRQIERSIGELNVLNDQVRELPNTQQEVLRLVRDAEVNTVLYTSLLNTAQELRVVKAGTVGNVRVIDYAAVPYEPLKPKKGQVLPLSLLFGVILGVGAAFGREALSAGVDDPALIEKQTNIPIYATIAHSKEQDRIYRALNQKGAKREILAIDNPDDLAIESLRNLRTALHFGMMDVKNNCMMISGPSPTVGKSFVSVNLAAILTGNDKKVLLIDGDMRRGHLHEYLGVSREQGLSDFIAGNIAVGEMLHPTTIPGLTFVPTGSIPPNPAELLLHKRFSNCLAALSPRYDHIIIDSPPILAVTDASIIGQMAGATLIVLKAGQHPMREIELSVKRLRQAGVNLRGILLNDVDVTSRRYGAGKYSYQYSYEKS